jgi:hypothetical protein
MSHNNLFTVHSLLILADVEVFSRIFCKYHTVLLISLFLSILFRLLFRGFYFELVVGLLALSVNEA